MEALEGRIKMMENMLTMHAEKANKATDSASSSSPSSLRTASAGSSPSSNLTSADAQREDDYERQQAEVLNSMKALRITDCHSRYFGPASTFHLMSTALYVKATCDTEEDDAQQEGVIYNHYQDNVQNITWDILPWERSSCEEDVYAPSEFPEDDLLRHLIDIYFETPNTVNPVLHRPTFERLLREELHLRDFYFGAVVLMVCASAARYSADPRVLAPGSDDLRSAGWKWFSQVPLIRRKSLFKLPSVYELQYYSILLTCIYGTSAPQSAWPILGISIRYCQELGIHRKSIDPHFVHNEHWNRAFWSLVCMDRIISSFLGRQPCIQADDIDADLPVACDDEYWDTGNPDTVFKQPAHKPSKLAFFAHYVKITDVLAHALSTLYTTAKSRIRLGNVGPEWEQRVVADLDSELNDWLDKLPDHLRWDPKREDVTFFNQSSVLFATYYHVQILIHRPFVGKSSPVTFASLAMCNNAARACSRIFAAQVARGKSIMTSDMVVTAFTCAICCLMNIWGGSKMGLTIDRNREMEYVRHCLRYLEEGERRWFLAGRFKDQITNLMNMQEKVNPYPEYTTKKRPRSNSARTDAPSPSTMRPAPTATQAPEGDKPDMWNGLDDSTYWNVNNMLFPRSDPATAATHNPMPPDQSFSSSRCFDPFTSRPDHQMFDMDTQHAQATPSMGGASEADIAALQTVPMNDVFDMWSHLPSDMQSWDTYLHGLEMPQSRDAANGGSMLPPTFPTM